MNQEGSLGSVRWLWACCRLRSREKQTRRCYPRTQALAFIVVQSLSYVNSLQPHGLQHIRLPCPSLSPRACSNLCPSSRWCHPTVSSPASPFSSCPQSLGMCKTPWHRARAQAMSLKWIIVWPHPPSFLLCLLLLYLSLPDNINIKKHFSLRANKMNPQRDSGYQIALLLDCKEIQPVHPKGDQSWVFIGRTDFEAETPILWPPDEKNWLIWKDPGTGKDWGQEEKGMTENEMVGWHQWLNGHEFE